LYKGPSFHNIIQCAVSHPVYFLLLALIFCPVLEDILCVCVCVCVCVYVVYEDTNVYNDMGMTQVLQGEGDL